jgi:ankyrin repeat protein
MSGSDSSKLDQDLQEAVAAGDALRVEQLLARGASDDCQNSLFHMATRMKHFEITRLLTEYKQSMRPCSIEQLEDNILIAGQE